MIHIKDGTEVLDNLNAVISPGTGIEHWGASYFGPRYSTVEVSSGRQAPQALMTQMAANETILPHFHGVAQFQIFPSGAGVMGKTDVRPLMLQYKDHHSAYGPLVAGPHGLTFIAAAQPYWRFRAGVSEQTRLQGKAETQQAAQLDITPYCVIHKAGFAAPQKSLMGAGF